MIKILVYICLWFFPNLACYPLIPKLCFCPYCNLYFVSLSIWFKVIYSKARPIIKFKSTTEQNCHILGAIRSILNCDWVCLICHVHRKVNRYIDWVISKFEITQLRLYVLKSSHEGLRLFFFLESCCRDFATVYVVFSLFISFRYIKKKKNSHKYNPIN